MKESEEVDNKNRKFFKKNNSILYLSLGLGSNTLKYYCKTL